MNVDKKETKLTPHWSSAVPKKDTNALPLTVKKDTNALPLTVN